MSIAQIRKTKTLGFYEFDTKAELYNNSWLFIKNVAFMQDS